MTSSELFVEIAARVLDAQNDLSMWNKFALQPDDSLRMTTRCK